MSEFSIHLDLQEKTFDGPLDLLLHLIRNNDYNIYDIPISEITAQFIQYINYAEKVGLNLLSDFYRMAVDLIRIKVQMLLPHEKIDFEDDEYTDPRSELVEQLLEYSKFKKYADLLSGSADSANVRFMRNESDYKLPVSDEELFENVDIASIFETFLKVLKSHNILDSKVYNVYEEVTENEKLSLMLEMLETRESIYFTELFKGNYTPIHIVCSFLAILGAVKDHIITVSQDEAYGDILIRKRELNPEEMEDTDDYYDESEYNEDETDGDNYDNQ